MPLGVYGYVFVSLTTSLDIYLVIKDFTDSNKIFSLFSSFDKFGMLKMFELV